MPTAVNKYKEGSVACIYHSARYFARLREKHLPSLFLRNFAATFAAVVPVAAFHRNCVLEEGWERLEPKQQMHRLATGKPMASGAGIFQSPERIVAPNLVYPIQKTQRFQDFYLPETTSRCIPAGYFRQKKKLQRNLPFQGRAGFPLVMLLSSLFFLTELCCLPDCNHPL